MANSIGTAYIKIMPESKGIEGTIDKDIGGGVESAGRTGGGKYVKAFKAVLAAAALGKWIGDSVLAGADLEQSIGGIETLYKDASGKMMEYASQAYKTAGIDANTYMQQATSFSAALISSYNGDVDKAADATNQAMVDMADNANKMGTPLESLQNAYQGFAKQNYTMLDNLKLGYGGTKTEMERLLADAEKITGVHYDISELGDVYDAIHVIQTEMGITGTTSAEAAETISGSIGMWKASYQDLMANLALGGDVFPQIEALAQSTLTMLGNVLPAIGNVIIGIPKAIITHAPEIYAAVSSAARNAFAIGIGQFGIFIQNLPGYVSTIANTILANAPLIIDKVKTILQTAIVWIGQYAPQILNAVLNIAKNIGVALITNLPAIIKSVFNLAVSVVKTGVSSISTAVKNGVATVKNFLTQPFQSAIDKIKGLFPLKLGKIFDGIKLPHFKISGGKIPWGIGGAGEKPSVNVEWYAKGGIMTKPTLFGGGEAGAEAIMPLDPFWDRMENIADAINNSGEVVINVYGAQGQSVDELARAVEQRIVQLQNRRKLAWQ